MAATNSKRIATSLQIRKLVIIKANSELHMRCHCSDLGMYLQGSCHECDSFLLKASGFLGCQWLPKSWKSKTHSWPNSVADLAISWSTAQCKQRVWDPGWRYYSNIVMPIFDQWQKSLSCQQLNRAAPYPPRHKCMGFLYTNNCCSEA